MATTICKIAVLMALSGIGFISLFAVPEDEANYWSLLLLGSKALAVSAIYATAKLFNRWKQKDKWLKAYDEECNEALDAPNPMYYENDEDED